MKKVLLLITILIAAAAHSQTGAVKYNQLTGADLNEATYKVASFLSRKMKVTRNGDQAFNHVSDQEVIVTQEFKKFNDPEKKIIFTFNTTPADHRLYINDISVTGDQELLIEFYVRFWKTTIEIEAKKSGLLASSRFLNDQVALYTGAPNKLTVTAFK